MKKKIISILLVIIIVAGLVPLPVSAQSSPPSKHLEYDPATGEYIETYSLGENEATLNKLSVIEDSRAPLLGCEGEETWYYTDKNLIMTDIVNAVGDVHIILQDGVSVSFNYGLLTQDDKSSITFYAQSDDKNTMGRVYADGDYLGAAIGSDANRVGGSLTIHGGRFTLTGGEDATALGAGSGAHGFTTTIYGGYIIATGTGEGSALGGGCDSYDNTLNIFGGEINAAGGTYTDGDDNTVKAPALGCTGMGNCTVSGDLCYFSVMDNEEDEMIPSFEGAHNILLQKRNFAAHMKKTVHQRKGVELNDDGSVKAYGYKEYYECFCGKYFEDVECKNEIDNIEYWKGHDGQIYTADEVTLTFDLNYACEDTVYFSDTVIPPTLYAPPENPLRDGYSFGGWYTDKNCEDQYRFDFSNKITKNTTFYAKWIEGGYYRYDHNKEEFVFSPMPDSIISLPATATTLGKVGEASWYYADRYMEFNTRVKALGNVNIILKNGVTVKFNAGLGVDASYNAVAIYAQSLDKDKAGTLYAKGSNQSAGIGSGDETDCGIITIYGGNIQAYGAKYGAGIGGGDISRGGEVDILGGFIYAEGGDYGAGIGTGDEAKSNKFTVYITGGEIAAKGGAQSAGIGGGGEKAGNFDVKIYGGNITAVGGSGAAGIGGGQSGSKDGRVYFYGGTVLSATGGENGAGIGSGSGGSQVYVEISDGQIKEAVGGKNGAGIGSGYNGAARVKTYGNAEISDSFGGYSASGIGSGYKGTSSVEICDCRYIHCQGGADNASSENHSAGIGGGVSGSCAVYIDTCILDVASSIAGNKWIDHKLGTSGAHTFIKEYPRTAPVYAANGTDILVNGCLAYYQCEGGAYYKDKECTELIGFEPSLTEWKESEGIDNYSYPVNFYYNRGNEEHITVAVDFGGKVTPPEMDVAGAYLLGWYTDPLCADGTQFDFSTDIYEEINLYAKWMDGYYLAFNPENSNFENRTIPSNTKSITYSGSGNLTLSPDLVGTTWFLLDSDITVSGEVLLAGNVNLILKDGCTLTCQGITGVGGSLTVYAQSRNEKTMGKLISTPESTQGFYAISTSVIIHGGSFDFSGSQSSKYCNAVDVRDFTMYGGYLKATGGEYSRTDSHGNVKYSFGKAIHTSGMININYCGLKVEVADLSHDGGMVNLHTTDNLRSSFNEYVSIGNKSTVHTKGVKTDEVSPYITEDGTLVDGCRAYYTCACGKHFSDENLKYNIYDLEKWKKGDGRIPGVIVTFDFGYDNKKEQAAAPLYGTVGEPQTPERDGYQFLGWETFGGDSWNFSDSKVTYAITLYAKWKFTHVHKWSDEWSFDGTHHWHECENSDCTVTDVTGMDSYGEHTVENFVCTVCSWEDLESAKDYAYEVIDTEVAKCPSEVHMADAVQAGTYTKYAIALSSSVAEIFDILDAFAELMIIPAYTVTYYDENGEVQKISDYAVLRDTEESVITLDSEKWYVAEKDFSTAKTVLVSGDVNIILRDSVTFKALKGISVPEGCSLTVYSESLGENMGALNSTGKSCAAGIGGYLDIETDEPVNAGDITINGGNITANGGRGAAGIGGGFCSDGGDITVNNGKITAYGNAGGAGIGGGHYGNNGAVTVNGGTVDAHGADDAAGIGGGYSGEGGTVTVNNVDRLTANGFRGIGAGMLKSTLKTPAVADTLTVKGGDNAENAKKTLIITEEAYIEITPYVEPVIFETMSLTLDGAIGVNFYVQINDMEYVGDNAYMTMEFDNFGEKKTEKVDLSPDNYDETKGKYKFTFYVNSLQMAEDINATFYYGEDESIAHTTSVKKYAEALVDGSTNPKSVELAKAILAYGYWAQLALQETHKFTLGEDGKYDAMPTPENTPDTSIDLSEYALAAGGENDSIEALSMSLALDNRTDIYLYVTTDTEPLVTGADVEIEKVGERYRITIPNIAAHELATTYSLDIGGLTVDVSAFSYINSVLNSETRSENYKKAVAALYEYYTAAIAYAK